MTSIPSILAIIFQSLSLILIGITILNNTNVRRMILNGDKDTVILAQARIAKLLAIAYALTTMSLLLFMLK